MTPDTGPTREQLERAIDADAEIRAALGDEIADTILAALTARLAAPDESGSAPRRRRVTVLFMDVVDSTGLLRDRDPEETMEIMDAALERLARPIAAHGGRVTRFMGDGYLAVFGIPTSRENDPELAVRAALAVQAEAAAMAPDLAERHGLGSFAIRIGINTGLVVSGGTTEAEDTIMGAEVNLAARLESAAPTGGVLISHGTLQHVRDVCEVEARGEIEAKGFPEPVATYLVLGMIDETRRTARPVVEGIETPMIGRESEMGVLGAALDETVAAGTRHVVTVSGQPGLGKTRLVREFEDAVAARSRRFRARVGPEDRDVPYGLIRDLLVRTFDLRIGDGSAEVRRKLADGLEVQGANATEAAGLVARLTGFEAVDSGDDPLRLRDRALAHIANHLRPDTDGLPTVIVAEDLQWADEASLAALHRLSELLETSPTLLVAVARPEFWSSQAASGFEGRRLDVEPLEGDDAGALVDAILGGVDGDVTALRRLLLAGAEGNPHFLEELVRMLVDDGVLVRVGTGWTIESTGLRDLRVPPTLAGVVQARLDALDDTERAVLQHASVVGRVFWSSAVAHLSGADADEAIARLAAREMVVARDVSAFADTDEFAFRHPVLREVAYEAVLLDDRRTLHGRTADWLLERARDGGTELSGVIATHLEKAGRGAEALDFFVRAGDAARLGYAVTAAADFYDRGLALVDPDDLECRFDLLYGRQLVWGLQGDRVKQADVIDEAAEVASRMADRAKQALVGVQRTWNLFYLSDFPGALQAAADAAELASAEGDRTLESKAHSALAWAHISLDELDRARMEGETALRLAKASGDPEEESSARNTLAMVCIATGDASGGSVHLARALTIARETGNVDAEATFLNNLAVARMLIGDFDAAWGHFSAALELAEAGGDLSGASSAFTNLAWVATSRADHESACDLARRALAMKRSQGHREAEAEALLWLGHALCGLERFDEALKAYAPSLAIREELAQVGLALGVRAGMARALLAGGDEEGALAQVEPIVAHLDEGGTLDGTWEPIRIHLTCVEVLEAVGDPRRDRVLDRAVEALEARAAGVEDADDRRLLLENIPWHRRVLELSAGTSGS